jgi:hypothetical protein
LHHICRSENKDTNQKDIALADLKDWRDLKWE